MKSTCFCFVLWLCISIQPAFADSSTNTGGLSHSQSRAEVLKEFLSSKREAGEVVYTWYLPGSPNPVPGLGKPMPEIKAVFWAKWQPDAYCFMQLKGTNKLTWPTKDEVQAIVGKVGEKTWAYDNGYLRIYDNELSESAADNLRNRRHWALSQLYATLGFGILHIPGSLKWDKNKFVAAPLDGGTLEGRLITPNNGVPDEIITTFNGHEGTLKLRYHESNERNELPYGYDRVSILSDGKKLLGTEVRILSLSLTNSLLPSSAFEPQAVLASLDAAASSPSVPAATRDSMTSKTSPHDGLRSNKIPSESSVTTIVHSNKHDYFVRRNALVRMTGPPEHAPRGWFLVMALVFVAVPFALFFLLNRKNRKETRQ